MEDEPILLMADSMVALVEAQRGLNDAVTQQLRAAVEALRAAEPIVIPAPVVNVTTPEVRVIVPDAPAPTVTVNTPDRLAITSMPRARIVFKRGADGRITEAEVV